MRYITFLLIFMTISSHANESEFTIIAHRGASGYLPEHTFASTVLAHAQEADYIEQDVVLTKDGVPIVVHDIHLENTTNVAQIFPKRARKDGRFYVIDFTLAEISTLTINERKSKNKQVFNQRYQGNAQFRITTLADQIELINQLNKSTGKNTGLYIEVKSPSFHRKHGQDISKKVINILRKLEIDTPNANVFIQCFDFNEIKRMRTELNAKVKLIQLIGEDSWLEADTNYTKLKTEKGMLVVSQYADGIGPWLNHLTSGKDNQLLPWVNKAKALGLLIHPYTFRTDALPAGKKH